MIPVFSFAGKRVALFGLGGSGIASASALLAGGADVLAFDDSTASVERARTAGIPVGNLRDADWSRFSALLLAPGVPLTHPQPHWTVRLAQHAGIEIIGDIELFSRERRLNAPDAPLIAITGTNGKSTTTALIAHLLRSAGRDVQLGGNIGTAILSLQPPGPGRIHVVEVSSFQIDLAPSLAPTVGILLNLSEDHLDRHGTFDRYASLKERLVAAAGTAIVGIDDDCRTIADRLERRGQHVVRISARHPVADGVYAEDDMLYEVHDGAAVPVASLTGIGTLRGRHNAENAAAAVAAVRAIGIGEAEIAAGLASFPGLPHRLEEVGRRGKVLFINDSKATNADATAKALASFDRIYWIAGGRPKSGGIVSLAEFWPRIARAYLIGEATEGFAATLGRRVPHVDAGTLEAAVAQAAEDAASDGAAEPVVLLSPACASYDQFRDFAARGDRFRAIVQALDGVRATGRAKGEAV